MLSLPAQPFRTTALCASCRGLRCAHQGLASALRPSSRMSSREFVYAKEERVYAFHGPLLYVAKVLDQAARAAPETAVKVKLYLLQYEGFDSHWDEWVPESRIMKDDKKAEELQKERVKEFNRAQKRRNKQSSEGGTAGAGSSSAAASKKQRTGDRADFMLVGDIKEQLRLPPKPRLIDLGSGLRLAAHFLG